MKNRLNHLSIALPSDTPPVSLRDFLFPLTHLLFPLTHLLSL